MRGGRVHTGINDLSGKTYRRDNHRKKILWHYDRAESEYDLFGKIHWQDKRVNAWHDGV